MTDDDEDLCDEEEGEEGGGKRGRGQRKRQPSEKALALPLHNLHRRDPFEESQDYDSSLDDDT